MRRSHTVSLITTVLLTAIAVVGALAAGWSPVLGLDLQGGVAVVLEPTEPTDADTLDQAIEIIRNRVDAIGVAEPDITRQDQNVVVQLPGVDDAQRALDLVGQTAELRFRPVVAAFDPLDPASRSQAKDLLELLNTAADDATTTTTTAPTTTTTAASTESTVPDSSAASTTAPSSATTTATTSATATTATTAAGSATTTVTTAAGSDSTTATTTETTTPATTSTTFDVASAPDLADILTAPDAEEADATVLLPALDGDLVFVLGPTQGTGEIIANAAAQFNGTQGWIVNVGFTGTGADVFDNIAALNVGRQVAIAVDGVVYSAPTIQQTEFNGSAVISGTFDEDEAKDLALVLRFGALPVELVPQTVQTVSATLGQDALRAGVIAGIVGLALVAIYMIAFYRLLGVVAILSLMVSGGMLWFIISWLGEWQGLALTLAGATGIVLSIGVAVDSNIVYYESIKDQIRRGRAVRSAADASFPGAFSTIVKADMASIIGALILYTLTVGAVKGFALYLGIATMLDLLVSYVFMRPLVVLVTRRFAGNDPARLGVAGGEVTS